MKCLLRAHASDNYECHRSVNYHNTPIEDLISWLQRAPNVQPRTVVLIRKGLVNGATSDSGNNEGLWDISSRMIPEWRNSVDLWKREQYYLTLSELTKISVLHEESFPSVGFHDRAYASRHMSTELIPLKNNKNLRAAWEALTWMWFCRIYLQQHGPVISDMEIPDGMNDARARTESGLVSDLELVARKAGTSWGEETKGGAVS